MFSSKNPTQNKPQKPESNEFKTMAVMALANISYSPLLLFFKSPARIATAAVVANSAIAYALHEKGVGERQLPNFFANLKSRLFYPIPMQDKLDKAYQNIITGGAAIHDEILSPKNRSK